MKNKNKIKKIIGVSALGLLSSVPAFAVSAGPVQLNLTGSVNQSIAIDISTVGGGANAGSSASKDVGLLTEAITDLSVAEIGILSNGSYLVSAYSANGQLKCSTPLTCATDSLDYQLMWDDLSYVAIPVGGDPVPGQLLPTNSISLSIPSSQVYECSLGGSGCPAGYMADARHVIKYSSSAGSALLPGAYSDTVYFVVESQ